jgi:hypothetical protein
MRVTPRSGGIRPLAVALLAALLSTSPLSARTIIGGPPDLEALVSASNVICVAEVEGKASEFVNGRIETTYELRVDDYLLGAMGEAIELRVVGGEVEEPIPMAMVYDGQVVLSEGQDVLLFLEAEVPQQTMSLNSGPLNPAANPAVQVSHGDFGVYTIVDDPHTGERYAGRLGNPMMNRVLTDDVNRLNLRAAQSAVSNAGQPVDRSHRALKNEFLAAGQAAIEARGTQPPTVRNANGEEIDISSLMEELVQGRVTGLETPAAATHAEPEAVMPPPLAGARALDDLRDEIETLLSARGGGR